MKLLISTALIAGMATAAALFPAVCSGAAMLDAKPAPDASTAIWDNRITLRFAEPIITYEVEVVDSNGCTVSKRSELADGNRVIVHMKACERTGYPSGHMHVQWKVNGKSGQYHLHIRSHH
jgi:methionine-rich copper-binding protein CopC